MAYGKSVNTLNDRNREVRNNKHAARQANRAAIREQFDAYLSAPALDIQLENEEFDRMEYLDFHADAYDPEFDDSLPYDPYNSALALDSNGDCHNLRFYSIDYNFICDETGSFTYLRSDC